MTDAFFGGGNGWLQYLEVLAIYLGLFLLMRQSVRRIELRFRHTFWVLYAAWAGCVFPGNYIFYRIGIMSFLPWVNNFCHCFIWIGLCLGYLYSDAYRKPLWEQCAVFALYSFIVKYAENRILGTWEKTDFFGIPGHAAYLAGWSLMDGLYPILSMAGLRLASRSLSGILVPGQDPA